MVSTTFEQVIATVPQLATACIGSVKLKLLRLVSKQLCSAMIKIVSSYTLTLDGDILMSDKELRFFAATKLSLLRVDVSTNRLREYVAFTLMFLFLMHACWWVDKMVCAEHTLGGVDNYCGTHSSERELYYCVQVTAAVCCDVCGYLCPSNKRLPVYCVGLESSLRFFQYIHQYIYIYIHVYIYPIKMLGWF